MNLAERKSEPSPDFVVVAEQAAMDKVMDIHKDRSLKYAFIRFGYEDPSVDRLKGIFQYGVVSKRGNGISLTQRSVRNAFDATILRALRHSPSHIIPRENVYTLLIRSDTNPEILSRQRIPQGLFEGIVIIDGPQDNHPIISEGIDFKNSTTHETVENSVKEMLSTYKEMPDLCIPVYGLSGSLHWPMQKGHYQIQRFLKEKRK